MQRLQLWIIVALLHGIALVLYRFRCGRLLDVSPDAEHAIEKAK